MMLVLVLPSPKSHAKSVALVLRLVKFTVNGARPLVMSAVKSATGNGGGALVTVM